LTLGTNIKKARKSLNLTQSDLANLLGVTANYVAQIESSRKRPSMSLIKKISDSLKVRIFDLLENDEETLELRKKLREEILEEYLKVSASAPLCEYANVPKYPIGTKVERSSNA
jgi:transcriptional regulator with XRE-family HTH domain